MGSEDLVKEFLNKEYQNGCQFVGKIQNFILKQQQQKPIDSIPGLAESAACLTVNR